MSTEYLATVMSRPWLINRVTCGTLVTWSNIDNLSQDMIVSIDICLLGLILANILLFGPFLLSRCAVVWFGLNQVVTSGGVVRPVALSGGVVCCSVWWSGLVVRTAVGS